MTVDRFREIPEVLYSLGKLEILIASDNQIRLIDVERLIAMELLATLDLRNNDIMQVPPKLGLCTQLRWVGGASGLNYETSCQSFLMFCPPVRRGGGGVKLLPDLFGGWGL